MELEAKTKPIQESSAILACDRLSSLPDCLLHEIMSRLKARQVVQTCVLATRWRYLWRSVPCLDIDHEEFVGALGDFQEFTHFTDHLLINNFSIAHLDAFRLHVVPRGYTSNLHADRWIRYAIKYSTKERGIQRKGLASSSCRLKKLHLSNITLDDSLIELLGTGCPYLEDLELTGCFFHFDDITSYSLKNLILKYSVWNSKLSAITSPTLQSLVIDECDSNFLVVITAPAVSYMRLDAAYFPISLNRMPVLAEASIRSIHTNEYGIELGVNYFKVLDSVSNVTYLCLSDIKAVVTSEEFPKFQNLRTLLLEKCDLSDYFEILGHFLQNSPNLEKFTLRDCKFSEYPEEMEGEAKLNNGCLNQVGAQCKNLKVTEIIYEDDCVQNLLQLWLSIPGNLPKNNIKLTKVDPQQ